MKDFYVYLHRRLTDGKVFYVGKGRRSRSTRQSTRSKHWLNIVNKHGFYVEFYATGLQEWYAFELEIQLIAYYGRENLCNYTDGGEGCSGRMVSEEQKQKLRDLFSGKCLNGLYGNNHPSKRHDVRKKISESHKGKKKQKLSDCKKGKQIPCLTGRNHPSSRKIICDQLHVCFCTIKEAMDFLLYEYNKKTFSTNICAAASGKRKSAYGFTWSYV